MYAAYSSDLSYCGQAPQNVDFYCSCAALNQGTLADISEMSDINKAHLSSLGRLSKWTLEDLLKLTLHCWILAGEPVFR
jgi:hypothetical protein